MHDGDQASKYFLIFFLLTQNFMMS